MRSTGRPDAAPRQYEPPTQPNGSTRDESKERMASIPHAVLVELFRHQPTLGIELLTRLQVSLPEHQEVRVEHAESHAIAAPDSEADLVLSLRSDKPVLGIIVEVQLHQDTNKRYVWPHYVSALRARLRCPVVLCVVTPKRSVARWAATPIRLGGRNVFQATVIGPAAIPAVTERERAEQLPELAVLSAIAHGRSLDHERAANIADAAIHASEQLEPSRATNYIAVVLDTLSDSARKLLHAMNPLKYNPQNPDPQA